MGILKGIVEEAVGSVVKTGAIQGAIKATDAAIGAMNNLDEATIIAAEKIEAGAKKIAIATGKSSGQIEKKRLHVGDEGTDYVIVNISEDNVFLPHQAVGHNYEFEFLDSKGKLQYRASTQTHKKQKIKVYDAIGNVAGEIKAKGTILKPALAVSMRGKSVGDFVKTSWDDKSGKYQLQTIRIKYWAGIIEILNDKGQLLANEHRIKGKRCIVFQSNDDALILAMIYICALVYSCAFGATESRRHTY